MSKIHKTHREKDKFRKGQLYIVTLPFLEQLPLISPTTPFLCENSETKLPPLDYKREGGRGAGGFQLCKGSLV